MARPLCVITSEIGVLSETFVRWDVEDLLPGGTVVVSDPPPKGQTVLGGAEWGTRAPRLAFDPVPGDPSPSPERHERLREFLAEHEVEAILIEFLDVGQRWLEHVREVVPTVVIRGHGVDLSARLRDPDLVRGFRRLAAADWITTPSQTAADRLVGIGLPAERVRVFRQPVDAATSPPAPRRSRGAVRCVCLGRLVPKKGILESITAFAAAAGHGARIVLDVIGEGPLEDAARGLAEEGGVADRVRFHGALPHQEALKRLRDADILLHHAATGPDGDAEGLPVAVLEAMAAGLTVIATRHEGIAEAIEPGVSGLLVAENDVDAMAQALLDAAASRTLQEQLGRQAWEHVRRVHAADTQRQEMLDLLRI